MTLFTLATLNMEYGKRYRYPSIGPGSLLSQSEPDIIFIQESCPSKMTLSSNYQLLDFSNLNSSYNMDLSERMDIYINNQSPWKLHHQFQIDTLPRKSPRQSKIVVLVHNSTQKRLVVANVHLVGGRYDEDDRQGGVLKSNLSTLRRLKIEILEHLVAKYQVDLIAGDFNSDLNCYLNKGIVASSQLSFFHKVSPGKSPNIYREWNLAPYNYLQSQGYQLAQRPIKNSEPVYTSIFKNHPDSIWFNPSRGHQKTYNILDFLSSNLSDHNGLQISLEII